MFENIDVSNIVLILVCSAVIAWATVQGLKKSLLARFKFQKNEDAHSLKKRFWWFPLLVFLAMGIGFGTGAAFTTALKDWSWVIGGLVGAIGGALSSLIVSLFKKYLKSAAEKL